jgi:hypothetical protein
VAVEEDAEVEQGSSQGLEAPVKIEPKSTTEIERIWRSSTLPYMVASFQGALAGFAWKGSCRTLKAMLSTKRRSETKNGSDCQGGRTVNLSTGNKRMVCLGLGVLAICFFLLGEQRSFSQVDTGSIAGTITDSSGAVVPGAKVAIVAVATNQQRTLTTDNSGRYSSGPMSPGQYRVEVERTGFKRLSSGNIVLEIQQTAVMNFTMEVGGTTEEVTVTAAPPLIQTTDASAGSVIGEQSVATLPLNGRDYLQLSLLSEGTLPPPGQARTAVGIGSSRAGGFSAGAARTIDNNYLLDGFDNNVDDTGFDTDQAEVIKPSVDAVQEFKVQTSSYPAQFGRAAGGIVNLTLKSGTSQFHGTAYNYLRNEAFDAKNFFTVGKQPSFKRNDFGFSLGAPIVKNKAFGFFSWENLLLRESFIDVNTIPTVRMRTGDFSELSVPIYDPLTYNSGTNTRQPFPGNRIPSSRFDSVGTQLINLYPTPQNGGLSNNYTYVAPNWENLGRINTRVDYRISAKDQLSAIFNRESEFIPAAPTLPPPALGGNDRQTNNTGYGAGLTWTRIISPTFLTSTKGGWFSETDLLSYGPGAVAGGNQAAKVGLVVPPLTSSSVVSPTFTPSGYTAFGAGNNIPYYSASQNRQVINDTTWTKGAHNIQFGGMVEWIQTNNENVRNEEGQFTYSGRYTRNPSNNAGGNSVADFLLGDNDTVNFSTASQVRARATFFSGYLQDEWKANEQLSVSAGLRYQYLKPYHDIHDRMANVDLDTNPLQPQMIFEGQNLPSDFWRNSFLDFNPRLGLTYQLLQGKLVVRAGYGIYSPFQRFSPFGDSASLLANPPYTLVVVQTSNGITPNYQLASGVPANIVSLQTANSVTLGSQQRNIPHAYAGQWNLNLQYQFARNWMFQVGYFGTGGTHLTTLRDTNYVPTLGPGSTNSLRRFKSIFVPEFAPTNGITPPGVTISPLGIINRTENVGSSNFNSMQAKVIHELSDGFTVLAVWTWSKGLGNTADSNPAGSATGYAYQNPANLAGEYGRLATNLAQAFVFSGLWQLPYGRGRQFGSNISSWADAVLGGWGLSSIVSLSSARYFTVTVNGTPSNSGQTDRANLVGNPNAVPGGRTVNEFFNIAAFQANAPYTYGDEQRNSILGPNYRDLDFSLSKTGTMFSVKDQPVNLQFRWDVFNAFNHPNFGVPGSVLGTATFGKITSADDPRQMQLALKVIF